MEKDDVMEGGKRERRSGRQDGPLTDRARNRRNMVRVQRWTRSPMENWGVVVLLSLTILYICYV